MKVKIQAVGQGLEPFKVLYVAKRTLTLQRGDILNAFQCIASPSPPLSTMRARGIKTQQKTVFLASTAFLYLELRQELESSRKNRWVPDL